MLAQLLLSDCFCQFHLSSFFFYFLATLIFEVVLGDRHRRINLKFIELLSLQIHSSIYFFTRALIRAMNRLANTRLMIVVSDSLKVCNGDKP